LTLSKAYTVQLHLYDRLFHAKVFERAEWS